MKKNINTDICVDLKTRLTFDRMAMVEKNYAGVLRRDSSFHFTFTETSSPFRRKKSPQLFNGRYVTVTCGEKGTLRLNLKAVYITRDFSAKEFSRELTKEIVSAVNGLVEEK